jgi:hypothetical protein
MLTPQISKQLKESVDFLERTLLAIDNVSNVAQEHVGDGLDPLAGCAHILHYLMEPALITVETLRVMIHQLQDLQEEK